MFFSNNNLFPNKTEKMLNWMNDLHPDPNDPNNVSFFEALKVCTQIKYINTNLV